jgi:hypothetical protein
MRKHFYLITEHEDEEKVGRFLISETRYSKAPKNEEAPITVLDKDAGDFREIGQKVHLGYADFDDEDDYKENVGEVCRTKTREVDAKWREKAGVHLQEAEA